MTTTHHEPTGGYRTAMDRALAELDGIAERLRATMRRISEQLLREYRRTRARLAELEAELATARFTQEMRRESLRLAVLQDATQAPPQLSARPPARSAPRSQPAKRARLSLSARRSGRGGARCRRHARLRRMQQEAEQ